MLINKSTKNVAENVNEGIKVDKMLVVTEEGEQLGVLTKKEALAQARAKELDLVLVAPQAKPPVAKFMNYSKFRYDQQKKSKEMKKNQKVIEVKEIRLSPTIDTHDLETKQNQARKFLEKGNKVKVSLKMPGRMITHSDIAREVMVRFMNGLSEIAKVESDIKQESRFLSAMLAPKQDK